MDKVLMYSIIEKRPNQDRTMIFESDSKVTAENALKEFRKRAKKIGDPVEYSFYEYDKYTFKMKQQKTEKAKVVEIEIPGIGLVPLQMVDIKVQDDGRTIV